MFKGVMFLLVAATLGMSAAEKKNISSRTVSHSFNPALVVFSDDLVSKLKVPPGFGVNVFARGQGNARMMLLLPDGTILLTRNDVGELVAMRDKDGDGVAEDIRIVARIPLVHGIALRDNMVYLANETSLFTMSIGPNGTFGTPAAFAEVPPGGLHPRRTLGFDDAGWLYVSVGSDCNNCEEHNSELATILRMKPDGGERSVFARGLRNALGFAWHPATHALWGWDNGSDGRGDNLPPEELNLLRENHDYGWPFCYGNKLVDKITARDPSFTTRGNCANTTAPVRTYRAHSAPITLLFYSGTQFPLSYRNNGFVSFHGSWNREHPAGYKVVRIRFAHGAPMGFQDFVTGWLFDKDTKMFGRPAGLVVAQDGSLLISDDNNGVIYRVSYHGRTR
jgi:glucose/arabinose dehydrogenase